MHLILFIFLVFMINFDLKLDLFMGARKTFEIKAAVIKYGVTYPEIFWEYRFQQGIHGQGPKTT